MLSGRIGVDDPAPSGGRCVSLRPCPDCQREMETGVILIGVISDDQSDFGIPVRYGEPLVVSEATVLDHVGNPERRAHILRERWAYVEKEAFDLLDLGDILDDLGKLES